jgi:Extensin-like protein C-terminus
MTRGVRWFLVGSLVLVTLAGCGRNWIAQRAPWRHEAEVACLKSGAVREGPSVVRIEPIEGPGVCGADFPLKVSALGESNAMSYADELRPPASIPGVPANAPPRWPIAEPRNAPPYGAPVAPSDRPPPEPGFTPPVEPRSAVPGSTYDDDDADPPGAPLSLTPPGLPQPNDAATIATPPPPDLPPQNLAPPPASRPPSPPPALGPARAPYSPTQVAAAVEPPATLACPIVAALDQWVSEAVQPAAMRWFGQPVVAIKQISAYSCRGMNGNSHARISEHAFGNALDIAAFTLADGRRITVKDGWHGSPEEQGFLRDVQGAACERFTTVLAPGYNVYHYNHIHVDLMRRASGHRSCRPHAVSGELVAARARARLAGRRVEPGVTGSAKSPGTPTERAAPHDDEDQDDDRTLFGNGLGGFIRSVLGAK